MAKRYDQEIAVTGTLKTDIILVCKFHAGIGLSVRGHPVILTRDINKVPRDLIGPPVWYDIHRRECALLRGPDNQEYDFRRSASLIDGAIGFRWTEKKALSVLRLSEKQILAMLKRVQERYEKKRMEAPQRSKRKDA